MLTGCVRVPNQKRCNMYGSSSFLMYVVIVAFILTWLPDIEGIPSRSEQCRNYGYDLACELTNFCSDYNYHCKVLLCGRNEIGMFPALHRLIPLGGVEDGTPCGLSKVCKHKRCVDEEEPVGHRAQENDLVYCTKRRYQWGEPIKTREEQCQAHGFDVACEKGNRTSCNRLSCGYEMGDHRYMSPPVSRLPIKLSPSQGTRCGTNKVCVGQKCVPLSKWPGPEGSLIYTGEENFWPCSVATL